MCTLKNKIVRVCLLGIALHLVIALSAGCLYYKDGEEPDGGSTLTSGTLSLKGYPVSAQGRDKPPETEYCQTLIECVCPFSSDYESCYGFFASMTEEQCEEDLFDQYSYCEDDMGSMGSDFGSYD